MKTLRLIVSILLAIGGFAVFNDSGNFTWNFVGLACLVLLVAINIDKETLDKIQNQ